MLTNFIQPDAASSSGSPNQSAPPFPSAGPGPSSFASTLQSAQAPAPATPQLALAVVGGRGKPAEKKAAENSKTTSAAEVTPAAVPAVIGDSKAASIIAFNLVITPPGQDITGSMATAGPILPPASSRSDGTIASNTGANSARQATSFGLAREFQRDALTDNAGTVVDSASSVALAADKPTPKGDLASQPNVPAAPVKPIVPLPVSEVAPPPAPLNESAAGQSAITHKSAGAPSVASAKSMGAPALDVAVLDAPAQKPAPAVATFSGTATADPRPVLVTPAPTAMGLYAMDAPSGTVNAASGVNQSAPDSRLQAAISDLLPGPATPIQSAMALSEMDPTGSSTSAVAAVKQSSSDGMSQVSNGDLRFVLMNPTQSAMSLDEMDGTSAAAIVTGGKQPVSDNKPQAGSGPGQGKLTAPASSFTVSGKAYSAQVSRPISLPAAVVMKAEEANPDADARAKETPMERVPSNQSPSTQSLSSQALSNQAPSDQALSNQVPSNQAPSNQAPSNQVLSNQAGTRTKLGDSSANAAETNVLPPPTTGFLASLAVPASAGNAPSDAAATANILAQFSPAVNQESGSRTAVSPAVEPQSPAATPPPVVPTVGLVEAARLVAGVAQSEMHIGLRTQAFGSVEVHTVVRDSQVGVSVGSERGDLRTFLSTEVSGLQTTFRQQDLRFDSIRFLETSAGTTAGFSGGADSQPRSSSQQHSAPAALFSIHGPPADAAEVDISAGLRTRLNVHA